MRIRELAVSILVTVPVFAMGAGRSSDQTIIAPDVVQVHGTADEVILGSDVVLVAHSDEQKNDDDIIDAQSGSKNDIHKQLSETGEPLARYESRLRRLAAEVKRDAFIVSQLAAAVGELNDFQQTIAISKAGDRIAVAQKRANEDPVAPISTQQMLAFLQDPLIKHAREQGTMADTSAVRREILLRSAGVQSDLFRELDSARTERQALVALDQQLNGAMVEALGAAFDIVRTGGK
jgi:hypothetical protein